MRFLADTPTYDVLDAQDDDDEDSFLDASEEGYVEPDLVDAPLDPSPEDELDPEDDSDLDDGADVSSEPVEGTEARSSRVRVRPTSTGALDLKPGVQSVHRQTLNSFASVDHKPMPSRLQARGIVFAVLIGKDGVARVLSEQKKGHKK